MLPSGTSTPFHTVFIALGSNLDKPRDQVRRALGALESMSGMRKLRCSSLYQTEPVGNLDQPMFINAVASAETMLAPEILLDRLRAIEADHGRIRGEPNGPRTLDLDLLLYDDLMQSSPSLTLPHPRMHERAFVLVPLAELAPNTVIPGIGRVCDCLSRMNQQGVSKAG